jgi:hypothetical protein
MRDGPVKRPHYFGKQTTLIICVALLLGIGVFVFVRFSDGQHPKASARRVGHATNMRLLGVNLRLYADEHGSTYPSPEKWCDVLVEWSGGHLRDALRYPKGEREGCPYAMNPHAHPHSPSDVVFLFESRPGWNQAGGPELLTTENHGGRGCWVVFADGQADFVAAADISGLRWTDEGTLPPEKGNE